MTPDQHLELGVIAGMMIDPDQARELVDVLSPAYFGQVGRNVFKAACELVENEQPVTDVLLKMALQGPDAMGFVDAAWDAVITPSLAHRYAELLAENNLAGKFNNRLVEASRVLTSGSPGALDNAAVNVRDAAEDVLQRKAGQEQNPIIGAYEQFQKRCESGKDEEAVPTGFRCIDRVTAGGFRPGDMCVVAGRPGMGKTALAMNIACNVALRTKFPTLFVSLEQTERQLAGRAICAEARIPSGVWLSGNATQEHIALSMAAGEQLATSPLYLVGRRNINGVPDIARAVYRRIRGAKPALVVIDYIQRMARRISDRYGEITSLSGQIKDLALATGLPFLVVAQLKRIEDYRNPPVPLMSDLKESGGIEQDADFVGLLYRPGYYRKQRGEKRPDHEPPGYTEFNVAKQRNGPTGILELYFDSPTIRFKEDWDA